MSDVEELLTLAEASQVVPQTDWGVLRVVLPAPVDLVRVRGAVDRFGFVATGIFGTVGMEVDLDSAAPAQSELDSLAGLANSPAMEIQIRGSASGWAAAEHLVDQLTDVELTIRRPNWCHSAERFIEILSSNWLVVADALRPGPVEVEGQQIDLSDVGGSDPIIRVPAGMDPQASDLEREVWDGFSRLADVAAWRNLAVDEKRLGDELYLSLHRDQPSTIAIAPVESTGGLDLYKWLKESPDGNREESLRHILRFLTASSPNLPNGAAVRTLAERQRIALSRENAAEVQRAISDGQLRTAGALDDARDRFAQFLEDTSKTAQASVVASVGVVALVARSSDALPNWLLVLVSAVASIGLAALVITRWNRLGELAAGVQLLREQLERDPLLPKEERDVITASVDSFLVGRRRRNARGGVVALGGLALAVVLAATWWLISRDQEPQADGAQQMVSASGFVRWEGGVGELCADLSLDSPPECVEKVFVLRSVEPSLLDLGPEVDGVKWTSDPVRVAGTIDGSVLDVVVIGS